jgi:hypothetical protein
MYDHRARNGNIRMKLNSPNDNFKIDSIMIDGVKYDIETEYMGNVRFPYGPEVHYLWRTIFKESVKAAGIEFDCLYWLDPDNNAPIFEHPAVIAYMDEKIVDEFAWEGDPLTNDEYLTSSVVRRWI